MSDKARLEMAKQLLRDADQLIRRLQTNKRMDPKLVQCVQGLKDEINASTSMEGLKVCESGLWLMKTSVKVNNL